MAHFLALINNGRGAKWRPTRVGFKCRPISTEISNHQFTIGTRCLHENGTDRFEVYIAGPGGGRSCILTGVMDETQPKLNFINV